jgi:hypothetical protein
MYFSLQYLSLSDAVVLKFLAPILTGFSGAIFLKESLSLKGVIAGREHFMKCFDVDRYLRDAVCSFCGVVLIARPRVLFGGPQENPSEDIVTSGQRMISVTLGGLCLSRRYCTHWVS